INYVRLHDTVLQNAINIDFSAGRPRDYLQERVIHKPLPPHAPKYVILGTGAVGSGANPYPPVGIDVWLPQIGGDFQGKGLQGTGKDYTLLEPQQFVSTVAWPSVPENVWGCPELGITMGECWTKYGIAWRGDVITESEAIPLEGLINAVGRAGLATTFGPPR